MPASDRSSSRLRPSAETILDGADEAQTRVPVTLELDHDVNEVLEHSGTGDRAVLGDVTDEQDGDAALLGRPDEAHRNFAHLRHVACLALDIGAGDRLHGVDHEQRGARLDVAEDGGEIGLGGEVQLSASASIRSALARTCGADSSPLT